MRQKYKLPLIFTSIVTAAVVVLSDFAHKYESKVMQAAREIHMKFNRMQFDANYQVKLCNHLQRG